MQECTTYKLFQKVLLCVRETDREMERKTKQNKTKQEETEEDGGERVIERKRMREEKEDVQME